MVKRKTAIPPKIYYASTDRIWHREQKYEFLKKTKTYSEMEWQEIAPDKNSVWLTEGLQPDFNNLIALGTKAQKAGKQLAKSVIFKKFGIGIQTGRDAWAYNFDPDRLTDHLKKTIAFYNAQVSKWIDADEPKPAVDELVDYEDAKISWTSSLKQSLESGVKTRFNKDHIRSCLYRPFTRQSLYFDPLLTHRRGQFPLIAPTVKQENENWVICHTDKGSEKPFMTLMSRGLVDMHLVGAGSSTQCFPFYIYRGSNADPDIANELMSNFDVISSVKSGIEIYPV